MSEVRLIQGDCLKVLPEIAGEVDAVVADPPYGMGWDNDTTRFTGGHRARPSGRGRFDGRADREPIAGDEIAFDPAPWLEFRDVILWGSNHFGSRLSVGTTLIWIKRHEEAFGSFLSDGEVAWMKGGHGVYCRKILPNVRVRRHPNEKPVSLMTWCIQRLRLPPGSTILDPYMGSGSTGVAAIRLGFNFIGIEIDPRYFAIARKRIDAEQARHPLFEAPRPTQVEMFA